jgi:hypothetical protein
VAFFKDNSQPQIRPQPQQEKFRLGGGIKDPQEGAYTNPTQPYNPGAQLGGPVAPRELPKFGVGEDAPPDPRNYQLEPADPKTQQGFSMWRNLATAPGLTQFGRESTQQIMQNRNNLVGQANQRAAGAFGKAATGLQMRGGMNQSQQGVLNQGQNLQSMLAKQAAYGGAQNSLLEALKGDAGLKQSAMDKWAQEEQNYNDQMSEAAYRKYQLDLSKWAAGINESAYRTITGR